MDDRPTRRLLTALFDAAVAAVAPERVLPAALRRRGDAVYAAVVATGKAAPGMARAAASFSGDAPMLVVSDHVDDVPDGARLLVADHPVPGDRSIRAGEAVLALAARLGEGDRLLYLLSGGTSALVEVPRPGVTVAAMAAVTRDLLTAGASIHELNAVRRSLSAIKGGGLAAAVAPAAVTTLAISDVVDDDPTVIGSGPTVPPPEIDPVPILRRFGVDPPLGLTRDPAAGHRVKPERLDYEIVAAGSTAAAAAAASARSMGLGVEVHPEPVVGEARDAARWAVEQFVSSPDLDVLVLFGETTVAVRGTGSGGRNQEAALAAALALEGTPRIAFLAAGTDGIDGPTGAAGAVVDGTTAETARELGLGPDAALADNDSAPVLASVGAALVTGPTGTNVGDVWILARASSAG